MVFGERVASCVVASIVGAILASQYCASQMTGSLIYRLYTILHALSCSHSEACNVVSIVTHEHVYTPN